MNFQKHKLQKILKIYDNNLTANENIENNGWLKVWDLGHYKFKLFLN